MKLPTTTGGSRSNHWPRIGPVTMREVIVIRVGRATQVRVGDSEFRLDDAERRWLIAELQKEPIAP